MKISGIQDVQCETCHIYLLSSKSQSLNENHNCEDFKQKLADHGIKTTEFSKWGEVECPHCDLTFSTKKGQGQGCSDGPNIIHSSDWDIGPDKYEGAIK